MYINTPVRQEVYEEVVGRPDIRRVSLHGTCVSRFVEGERPVRPLAFEEFSTLETRSQLMDSDYFVVLCHAVASAMP